MLTEHLRPPALRPQALFGEHSNTRPSGRYTPLCSLLSQVKIHFPSFFKFLFQKCSFQMITYSLASKVKNIKSQKYKEPLSCTPGPRASSPPRGNQLLVSWVPFQRIFMRKITNGKIYTYTHIHTRVLIFPLSYTPKTQQHTQATRHLLFPLNPA